MKLTDQITTVELKGAFIWGCPSCGMSNACLAETLVLTPDEKRETMAQTENCDIEEIVLTDEELEKINFNTSPAKVVCENCEQEFSTSVAQIVDLQ